MPTIHDALSSASLIASGSAELHDPELGDLVPFEALMAVIVRRTAGRAGSRAVLDWLRDEGLLVPERLAQADVVDLWAGLKSLRTAASDKRLVPVLIRLAKWVMEKQAAGSWPDDRESTRDFSSRRDELREELASMPGIGVATADAILLEAFRIPVIPVDRASYRILARHGWIEPDSGYDEASELVLGAALARAERLDREPALVASELADHLAEVGRVYCRAGTPRCIGCPFESTLPEGGPLDHHA
jgi:endonuclease III